MGETGNEAKGKESTGTEAADQDETTSSEGKGEAALKPDGRDRDSAGGKHTGVGGKGK